MIETELALHEWWQHYRAVVNSDEEIHGHQQFSDSFYVGIRDER